MKKILLILLIAVSAQVNAQQDSLNMRKLAQWTFPSASAYNDIWGYAANGREYAILGSNWGTHFIDVTIPASPVEIASFPGKTTSVIWRDFKTYQHYCYGVADGAANSLQIFDLQYLPDSVIKVYDSTEFSISSHNIYIDGNRAYLNDNHRGSSRYPMEILSLANPAQPTLIGTLGPSVGVSGSTEVHDAYVKNDTVYASRGYAGHFIYDFRNPSAHVQIAHVTAYPEQGYGHSSWVHENGKYWVLADETHGTGLKLYDISNKANPVFMGLFRSNPGAIAHNPFIRGDSIYISYYHDGARVFSMEDTANIIQVSYYDTYPNNTGYPGYQGAWGVYPFLPSGIVLASDISTGLYILEMLPVTAAPNAQIAIEAQTGCAPFEVKFRNNTTGAFSYEWNFGDPASSSNTSTSSATLVSHVYQNNGAYTVRLIAANPAGSDTAFVTVTLSGTAVVSLPYFEDFETSASALCLINNAQSLVRYVNSNGSNQSKSLEFTGGNGVNYVSTSGCSPAFSFNPDHIGKASLLFDGSGISPVNLALSFGARLRWSVPPAPFVAEKSKFRVYFNDSLVLTCADTPGVIYSTYHLSLSAHFKPNTTNSISFEAVNRYLNSGIALSDFNSVFIDDIHIDNITGLPEKDLSVSDFKVFPNPSTGNIQILNMTGSQMRQVEIFSNTGKKVYSQLMEGESCEIDLGNLPTGLYMVRGDLASGARMIKLILTKD